MKVNQLNPATVEHIKLMSHYSKLMTEKRIIDNLEENRKREKKRVQECGKGQHVDIMV